MTPRLTRLRAALLTERAKRQEDAKRFDWRSVARPTQTAPDGRWKVWLLLAGRGFGKTRSGAEWVREQIEGGKARRMALVGPTAADVRDVMVEGESGLLAISPPWCRPVYEPSKRRLTWPNGAIATCYSADEPERLRGPQHDAAWCDELGAWRYPEAWDMLMFGLRLGADPRCVVTTTPKATALVRRIAADGKTVKSSGSTYDNAANLAPSFLAEIKRYEGTMLGRQEIHAELIDLSEGAILKPAWWRPWIGKLDACKLIVQSYDTAFSENETADYSARTTWGIFTPEEGKPDCALLMESWREQVGMPDLIDKAQASYEIWQPDFLLIENKASGISFGQFMYKAGIPVVYFDPHRMDKLARAHAASPLFNGGRVYARWSKVTQEFHADVLPAINECTEFPAVEHDDLTDTVTQLVLTMKRNQLIAHPSEPTEDDYEPAPIKSLYG